ncbi:hypothetical protein BGW39_002512, partial [Mortierella sp. 14UC]
MSESDSTLAIETAANTVLALPELMGLIGQCLPQSDLFSCVQVSQSWNTMFIPLLWHTHAIPSLVCVKIMSRYFWQERPREKIENWVKSIFEKHGHHVRNLTSHWNVILEAASLETGCKNLVSLSVNLLRHKHLAPSTVYPIVGWKVPWISGEPVPGENSARYKRAVERFWLLIRQNPGLVRLKCPSIDVIDDIPKEFILETFSLLSNLKDLDLERMRLDIRIPLDALPQL